MTPPAVAERPLSLAGARQDGRAGARGSSSERSGGGRLTLEQRLDSVWEGLRADGAADCPVCQGVMAVGAGGGVACCAACGSTLG